MTAAVTDIQLYLAIGVPVLANAAMFGLLAAYLHAKFEGLHRRLDAVNHRFDEMRGL